MARVTGIGGVFQKARDPKALAAWYAQHLGLKMESWGGAIMPWSDEVPAGTGQTTWSLSKEDSTHFPGRTMINYRVDDLDALLEALTAAGVELDGERQEHEFGKFGWVKDLEGNRVELWEPRAE